MYRIITMRVHRRQYNYVNSMTRRNRQGKNSYSKQPTCRYNALHTSIRWLWTVMITHRPCIVWLTRFHVYGTWQRTSQIRNVVGYLNTAYLISHSRPQEKKKKIIQRNSFVNLTMTSLKPLQPLFSLTNFSSYFSCLLSLSSYLLVLLKVGGIDFTTPFTHALPTHRVTGGV
jgi:hypothetical protein